MSSAAPVIDPAEYELFRDNVKRFLDKEIAPFYAHFEGRLEIGGISTVIAVSCAHREPSFLACRYIIEELKKRAPIWKKEHYIDGDDIWLAGHELGSKNG